MVTNSVRPRPDAPGRDAPALGDRQRQHRRRLEHDLADVERTRTRINRAVWGITFGVMIYGAINVTTLLVQHGVPAPAAPLLPLMVDLAMCAGLWGDRVMHRYRRHAAWVTGLRWIHADPPPAGDRCVGVIAGCVQHDLGPYPVPVRAGVTAGGLGQSMPLRGGQPHRAGAQGRHRTIHP